MVLKKSKWDRKAKGQYLRKHGLYTKQEEEVRPKWSSKKAPNPSQRIILQDSDDEEWDSDEDDAFINDFYPQIGASELTKEQKQKIKKQILLELAQAAEKEEPQKVDDSDFDGIYLGSEESKAKDTEAMKSEDSEDEPLPAQLRDFLNNKHSRKLLKAKVSLNLLEEYGIESYSSTLRKEPINYDSMYRKKQQERLIDKIQGHELDGFKIGDSFGEKSPTSHIRTLTEEEKEENKRIAEKANENDFYNDIRKKFAAKNTNKSKVIEINNINSSDPRQMEVLNSRLTTEKSEINDHEFNDDLDFLLGTQSNATDEIVQKFKDTDISSQKKSPEGQDFLDDLLG